MAVLTNNDHFCYRHEFCFCLKMRESAQVLHNEEELHQISETSQNMAGIGGLRSLKAQTKFWPGGSNL